MQSEQCAWRTSCYESKRSPEEAKRIPGTSPYDMPVVGQHRVNYKWQFGFHLDDDASKPIDVINEQCSSPLRPCASCEFFFTH